MFSNPINYNSATVLTGGEWSRASVRVKNQCAVLPSSRTPRPRTWGPWRGRPGPGRPCLCCAPPGASSCSGSGSRSHLSHLSKYRIQMCPNTHIFLSSLTSSLFISEISWTARPILTGLSILLSTRKLNSLSITSPSTTKSGSLELTLNSDTGIGGCNSSDDLVF